MATDTSTPGIVFYDVAFEPPHEKNTAAPNPWKARYALNFKGVEYSTKWVQLPDITKVRQGLGVPACRQFADGTDFYTLPILTDSETGSAIGDSFDIANWLQNKFPDAGAGDLFPSVKLDYVCPGIAESLVPLSVRDDNIHAEYAQFQSNVDMVFTLHVILAAQGMRWDPATLDVAKADMSRRAGVSSWDEVKIEGEAREKLKVSLRDGLRDLASMFQRDTAGPFLLGNQPSYADIIVGGWLRMWSKTLPQSEWDDFETWHDGVFGKLHAALQQRFGDVK